MRYFYAITSPYEGVFWSGDGSLLGCLLRFETKGARDARVEGDRRARAITAAHARPQIKASKEWESSGTYEVCYSPNPRLHTRPLP